MTRKASGLVFFFFLLSSLISEVASQYLPIQIYDLNVVTDSLNNDYLFFRIFEEEQSSGYFKRHIYEINTLENEERVFLEHYFDDRFGFPYFSGIRDFKIINDDPNKYIGIRRYCDNECSEYIERENKSDIFGGLFMTLENLNAEANKDNGLVYVRVNGQTIIGRNGGRNWPEMTPGNNYEVPDSSKLEFPINSLSPFDDSLMFGRSLFFEADSNSFYRSLDGGITRESLSDTLLPDAYGFDSNRSTVYIIDRINAPGNTCTFETCKYGLYKNDSLGKKMEWDLLRSFDDKFNFGIHPTVSGKIYVWNTDSILISNNFGTSFNTLVNPKDDVTGFTVSKNHEYYSTTYNLFRIENSNSIQLRSIPIANEIESEISSGFEILQNYPNPFNPTTTIRYKMSSSGYVNLKLYDITGRLIIELLNEKKLSGEYSFKLNASNLPSGTYIVFGRLGETTKTKIIMLIK